jgi:hypothetical protein
MSDKFLYSHRQKKDRQRCPGCDRVMAVDIEGRFFEHGIDSLCTGSFNLPTPLPHKGPSVALR